MRWVQLQRLEYRKLQRGGESNLTAQRLQRLLATGLDMAPKPENMSWEQRLHSLREFISEHGHCRPPTEDGSLGSWVSKMRKYYQMREVGEATSLTDERVNDLEQLGFVFKAGPKLNIMTTVRKTREERFEELLAFKEEHGHTRVPQLSGRLGTWVHEQRMGYKKMKASKKSPMTLEKALRLTEIGFCFKAARGGSVIHGDS